MTSPETAIGIAGGQATVGAPQTLPIASSIFTNSCGAKSASRIDIARAGIPIETDSRAENEREFTPSAEISRAKSDSGFCGVVISTT